jgi:hypothetical protein
MSNIYAHCPGTTTNTLRRVKTVNNVTLISEISLYIHDILIIKRQFYYLYRAYFKKNHTEARTLSQLYRKGRYLCLLFDDIKNRY